MPIALIAFSLLAFAVGATEFVTVGLEPTISSNLLNPVPSTGLLVTNYSVGVAIGVVLLAALLNKYNKNAVLIVAMVVFSVGHIVLAISVNFVSFFEAKTITGFTHGLFFYIGATIAIDLISIDKKASAIALVLSLLTLSMVIGVPFGTYIGQEFGWRNTFFIISLLGIISLIRIIFLPINIKVTTPDNFFNQTKILSDPRLLIAYLISIFSFGGPLFCNFLYSSRFRNYQ